MTSVRIQVFNFSRVIDLKRHPNNPWSLHGLAESLAQLGKAKESADIRAQFEKATERADVKIDRSCYCRLQ